MVRAERRLGRRQGDGGGALTTRVLAASRGANASSRRPLGRCERETRTPTAFRPPDLGLDVRAGCHVGEVELAGNDVRGLAVHIGARVAALADESELWVSSTVKDLTAGSGIAFEDAGEHELKGVPDRWHLYRVSALSSGARVLLS